jgi:hypothetical protein
MNRLGFGHSELYDSKITVGPKLIQLLFFNAIQVKYPLSVKASWKGAGDEHSEQI